MSISYQREKLADCLPEMEHMFPDHWQELALNQDKIKLAPDPKRYVDFEKAGMLHVFTVRHDGDLVGYYVSVIQTHPHYKNDLTDVSDMFYIKPEFRRGWAGIGFFQALENDLKPLGVKLMMTVIKPSHNIGPLLEYLGWSMSGYVFTKLVGE